MENTKIATVTSLAILILAIAIIGFTLETTAKTTTTIDQPYVLINGQWVKTDTEQAIEYLDSIGISYIAKLEYNNTVEPYIFMMAKLEYNNTIDLKILSENKL